MGHGGAPWRSTGSPSARARPAAKLALQAQQRTPSSQERLLWLASGPSLSIRRRSRPSKTRIDGRLRLETSASRSRDREELRLIRKSQRRRKGSQDLFGSVHSLVGCSSDFPSQDR